MTVPILAITKKTQKTSRAFREELFQQKPSSKRSSNRNGDTNRSFNTEIREPTKGYTPEIKKCDTDKM